MIKWQHSFILFILLSFTACKTQKIVASSTGHHISDVDGEYLMVSTDVKSEDQSITAMIKPYSDVLAKEMNEVLGTVPEAMYKGRPSSNLGNWLTDILKEEASLINKVNVDFALQNYGGIRTGSVAAGDLIVSKVFEIMPFDNELVTMQIPGSVVNELCQKIAGKGGWPSSDGLQMSIENNKAVNIMINGKPLDVSQQYIIALPDYVANGGDSCFFLTDYKLNSTGLMIRDVMIDHLRRKKKEGKAFNASNEERITQL